MSARRYWNEAMETIASASLQGLEDRLVRAAAEDAWARDLRITAISCTPSYMGVLARVVREELGMEPRDLGLRLGLFGGEPRMAVATAS